MSSFGMDAHTETFATYIKLITSTNRRMAGMAWDKVSSMISDTDVSERVFMSTDDILSI